MKCTVCDGVIPCGCQSRPLVSRPLVHAALPTDSVARKGIPIARGCLFYFPDALAAVAALSKKGNDKHNPGQELHWSRGKSNDHLDCILRHMIDGGPNQTAVDDEDGELHATKLAWRALANLQLAIERLRVHEEKRRANELLAVLNGIPLDAVG